ncbi:MAG: DUF1801 domain-containing protein [Pirellulales bacterium]
MAKKTQASKKRKTASPRGKSQKPARSAKKATSRISSANQFPAAKSTRAPRASSNHTAGRRATKFTKRPAAKAGRRAVKKSAKAGAAIRKTVDAYAATLNDWRKDCVASLRTMIRRTAPKASEKVKWSQPVYEHHGPFAWIKAHAKHVNLGFWRGVELPDPRKLLSGTGHKVRHIKLGSLKDAGKKELQEFVRLAARLNEIKGSPTRRSKSKPKRK